MRDETTTVVSANYNNGLYLADFVVSLQQSTLVPGCILVVDDCSTDNSSEILAGLEQQYDNLKVVRLPKNVGFANALNIGLDLVKTEFVVRLDPDDCVAADRFEQQIQLLRECPEVGVVGTDAMYFQTGQDGSSGQSNFRPGHAWIEGRYREGEHGVMHGTVAVRNSIFKKYRYRQEFVPAEDYDIFARMIRDGVKFSNICSPLTKVRIHRASVSNTLRFDVVDKTFQLRREIFGIPYRKFDLTVAFTSRRHYRMALFSQNLLKKVWHLLVASLFNPGAVLRRLFGSASGGTPTR